MDFNEIKEKITRKHVIAGISALVVIAGGITAGAIAMGSDDEKVSNNNIVAENVTEGGSNNCGCDNYNEGDNNY